MKNIHKIQGKREFLFDDRELVMLGGGVLVICLLIFALGFLVGKDWQEKSVASPLNSEDYLSSEKPVLAERGVNDTPNPEKSVQETSTDKKKPQLSYYQVLPDSDTFVEVEPTPGKNQASLTPLPDKSQPAKTGSDVPQQPAKEETQVKPVSPPQNIVVAPALPNVPKSPTDVIVFGRQTPQMQKRSMLTGTVYSVQVASSPSRTDSERLQQKYISLGYEAHIMTADLVEKGIWYRVRVGNFGTREEAEQLKREILQKAAHLANNPYVIKVTE
jgi:cell division protein FtsN